MSDHNEKLDELWKQADRACPPVPAPSEGEGVRVCAAHASTLPCWRCDTTLAIGSTIWVFDQNRREYRIVDGRKAGSPIWIKHWVARKIVGENRASWILESGDKFPKRNGKYTAGQRGLGGMRVALSWGQVEEMQWIEEHRSSLSQAVLRCNDAAVLRGIAALLEYKPE